MSEPAYMEMRSGRDENSASGGRRNSELASGMKAIEYKKMIFTDGEIYTDGNKIIIYLYKSGDVPGNPTGKPVQVAEEVFG